MLMGSWGAGVWALAITSTAPHGKLILHSEVVQDAFEMFGIVELIAG